MCNFTLLFLFVWMSLSVPNKAFAVPVFKNPLNSRVYVFYLLLSQCSVRGLLLTTTFVWHRLGTWVTPVTTWRTQSENKWNYWLGLRVMFDLVGNDPNKINHLASVEWNYQAGGQKIDKSLLLATIGWCCWALPCYQGESGGNKSSKLL